MNKIKEWVEQQFDADTLKMQMKTTFISYLIFMCKKICIYVLVLIILTSCVTIRCPGFDDNDRSQLSYRAGDSLCYVSNQHDTINLVVTTYHNSGPYEVKSVPDYVCSVDAYYVTSSYQGLCIQEHLKDVVPCPVKFGNDPEYDVQYLSEVNGDFKATIQDTTYHDMSCLKCDVEDLSGKRRISRYVKMEFLGIIEFFDKTTGLTWKLIEKK